MKIFFETHGSAGLTKMESSEYVAEVMTWYRLCREYNNIEPYMGYLTSRMACFVYP
jgi:hypothetical protein